MDRDEFSQLIGSGLLKAVLDSSMDGYAYTDANGDVLWCNDTYYKLSNLQPGSIDGHSIHDLVQQGYPVSELILQVQRTQETAFQVIQYTPGGNEILVSCSPVYDEGQNYIGVVSNFRDLSTLNEARSSLELIDLKYRMMLEQKDELLRHMRARLSSLEADVRVIGVIGESRQMRQLIELSSRISAVDSTVLITGESGVGKDIFCRLIHHMSGGQQPYVKVSCAAIPETLLESELFGYEPGAFTGASRHGKSGILEQAEGGIVFMDEIGDMPLHLQAKLLTLLQDRWYYRVGGTRQIPFNARIVAATNVDLKKAVAAGTFRGDLYYRLNVIPVQIPPLRERREDILPLVDHVLRRLNDTYGAAKMFSNDAQAALKRYDWPGNVRELNNIVERMYVLAPGDVIGVEMLPQDVFGPLEQFHIAIPSSSGITLPQALEQVEAFILREAVQKEATLQSIAQELGISLPTLERKLRKYGVPSRYQTTKRQGQVE